MAMLLKGLPICCRAKASMRCSELREHPKERYVYWRAASSESSVRRGVRRGVGRWGGGARFETRLSTHLRISSCALAQFLGRRRGNKVLVCFASGEVVIGIFLTTPTASL